MSIRADGIIVIFRQNSQNGLFYDIKEVLCDICTHYVKSFYSTHTELRTMIEIKIKWPKLKEQGGLEGDDYKSIEVGVGVSSGRPLLAESSIVNRRGEVKMRGEGYLPILFSSCRMSGTKIEHYLVALVKRSQMNISQKRLILCKMHFSCNVTPRDILTQYLPNA